MTERKKTAGEKSRASRRGKVLTNTEKAEAIALWRAGATTLDQLADKFHRDRSTFVRLFNKEGVTRGDLKEEHEKKVAEAVETAVIGDAAITAQRIRETKEQHYKVTSAITAETYRVIVKAKQEGKSVATTINDLKALQIAMNTVAKGREEKYALLGLNDEKVGDDAPLPDLMIQELTAAEIKQMHKSMEDEDEFVGIGEGDTLGVA